MYRTAQMREVEVVSEPAMNRSSRMLRRESKPLCLGKKGRNGAF